MAVIKSVAVNELNRVCEREEKEREGKRRERLYWFLLGTNVTFSRIASVVWISKIYSKTR